MRGGDTIDEAGQATFGLPTELRTLAISYSRLPLAVCSMMRFAPPAPGATANGLDPKLITTSIAMREHIGTSRHCR